MQRQPGIDHSSAGDQIPFEGDAVKACAVVAVGERQRLDDAAGLLLILDSAGGETRPLNICRVMKQANPDLMAYNSTNRSGNCKDAS